jgi:Holliday junction resolvasome RuvABC ATP-dependent DNA helicase subunit
MKSAKTLLSEKIATLEQEKSVLQTEITNLKKQIENLQQQLASLTPEQQGLDETAIKFLKILFDRGGETGLEYIAGLLGISKNVLKK